MIDNLDNACSKTFQYINDCYYAVWDLDKPLVVEEFGYPRDNYSITPGTPTVGRDRYYWAMFAKIDELSKKDIVGGKVVGCCFWAWGGYAQPKHVRWQPWDDYVGDPAQEEQGLNAVFASDTTTLEVIRQAAERLSK